MSSEKPLETGGQRTPSRQLSEMIMSFRNTQMIHVAAKLGIADLLSDGSKNAEYLAQATGAHPQALYRLLRALASMGIFAENDAGAFHLTPLAELLQTDVSESLRGMAMLYGEDWYWHAWSHLLQSVKTGKTSFEHAYGVSFYDYLAQHPDASEAFNNGLTGTTSLDIQAILNAYDFSGITTLVDIGGGHGSLITTILQAYPDMRGVLFEQSSVIAEAQARLNGDGVTDRCQLVGGSFFDSVPTGGDAYILKHVIHNWADDHAAVILKNCRQSINPLGKLLIVERPIPSGNRPSAGKLFDISMMVTAGGQERSEIEFAALLSQSGFRLSRMIPTELPMAVIIEATPVWGNSSSRGR